MFVVPLRPIDAAPLANLGRTPTPKGTREDSPRKTRRVWRRRPLPTHG